MARDGAGTYSLPVNSFNPAVAATDIAPADWNSTGADLATALTASIAKDGQTPATAVIPFALGATFGGAGVAVTGSTVPANGLYLPAANSPAVAVNSAEAARFMNGGLLVGATAAIANMDTGGGQVGAQRGFYTTANNGLAWGASTYLIGTNGVAINAFVGSGGASLLVGATAWSATSDETLKTPFAPFTDALNKVSSLKSGTGRYLTDKEDVSRSFLSAQSVQAVLPEAVSIQEDGKLALRYQEVVPLLVAALAEAKMRIVALEAMAGR